MKRRNISLHVADHAVLRYLQREHGIDIEIVRRHLAGLATNGAQLGAVAVQAENVRLFLRDQDVGAGRVLVTVSTVGHRDMLYVPGAAEADDA